MISISFTSCSSMEIINVSILQLRVHVLSGLQWNSQYSSQWVSGGVLLGNAQNHLFVSNKSEHNITEYKTLGALRMPACKDRLFSVWFDANGVQMSRPGNASYQHSIMSS